MIERVEAERSPFPHLLFLCFSFVLLLMTLRKRFQAELRKHVLSPKPCAGQWLFQHRENHTGFCMSASPIPQEEVELQSLRRV